MKTLIPIVFACIICFIACQPTKEIDLEGTWYFSEHIEGNAELNAQSKAMIKSITSIFKDGTISFKEGTVVMKSPVAGDRTGTYTAGNGVVDMEFGKSSQISLHIKNENNNLVILFNENGEDETGKIILTQKQTTF